MGANVFDCSGEGFWRMISLGIGDEAEFQDIAGNKAVLHAKLHSLMFSWHHFRLGSGGTDPPFTLENAEDISF